MDSQPQRVAEEWSWSPFERVVLAFCAVGVAGFAAWLTVGSLLVLGLAVECSSPGDAADLKGALVVSAGFGAATTLSWLGALSLARVAAGQRGLSKPNWIVVPAAFAALSMAGVAVATTQQPAQQPSVAVDASGDPIIPLDACAPLDS